MPFRLSIRFKIFTVILLAILIPLLAGRFLQFNYVETQLRETGLGDSRILGELTRRIIDDRGRGLQANAENIALTPGLAQAVLAKDHLAILDFIVPAAARLGIPRRFG